MRMIMTTPMKQAVFPPYKGPEEEPPKGEQAALDVVDRIVRYGGGVSPFASTGPENLTRANPLIQIFTQVLIAQRFRNDSK